MKKNVAMTVVVAALGYFVDIYDLILFSIVRVPSLKELGFSGDDLLKIGVHLLNMQMIGMLVGGIIWGVLGDKKGRISVLFGSIFLYSVANIANAFVTTVPMYAAMRFMAGLGLAGELGAAITLVMEIMPKETRGYGTAIVAAVGVSGAVVAALVGDYFTWKTAYIVGGVLGLLLLVLRIGIYESGMFHAVQQLNVSKGNLLMLLKPKARFLKYMCCILIGLPIWYTIGILITFSPEISRELNLVGTVVASKSVMYSYIGLVIGDFLSGFASQLLKSRKKIVFIFIILTAFFITTYVFIRGIPVGYFYFLCMLLGAGVGYWAVFVTMASEQFGTNLRATVTTTVPNFIRGSVVPITIGFQTLKDYFSLTHSALIIGVVCVVIALGALTYLKEPYGKDLSYLET